MALLSKQRNVYQHSRHQRYQDTPMYKERHYNRQRQTDRRIVEKKLKRPSRTIRAEFVMDTKQKILMIHGCECFLCNSTLNLEFHHVKFQSKNGRGTYRNGVPLCTTCHDAVHEETPHGAELAQYIRNSIIDMYGNYYYMDMWDLFKLGLITRPTEELYERFMVNQEILTQTTTISS